MKLDKRSTVTKKQRRMATKHIKGETNAQIGREEYPNAKPDNQRKIVHQQLNRPAVRHYLEQSKLQAMKQYNIGWDRVMKVIDKGLEATKADGLDDMPTQLRAAKQAGDYLELPKGIDDEKAEKLLQLPSDVSDVELVKLIRNN